MSKADDNLQFASKVKGVLADGLESFVIWFQASTGLTVDGWAGKKTQERFDQLFTNEGNRRDLKWHSVKASSFADPEDVRAFKACKRKGYSDQHCFRFGDNGIGAWGHDTAQNHTPMCALPREDWKQAGKKGGAIVLVRYNGGQPQRVVLGDTMPSRRYIKNGAGIDLNPAALDLFGFKAPILRDGFEWSWL